MCLDIIFMLREVYKSCNPTHWDLLSQNVRFKQEQQSNTSKGLLSLCFFGSSLCWSHLMPQSYLWRVFQDDNVTAAPPYLIRAAAGLPMSTSFGRFPCSYSSWNLLWSLSQYPQAHQEQVTSILSLSPNQIVWFVLNYKGEWLNIHNEKASNLNTSLFIWRFPWIKTLFLPRSDFFQFGFKGRKGLGQCVVSWGTLAMRQPCPRATWHGNTGKYKINLLPAPFGRERCRLHFLEKTMGFIMELEAVKNTWKGWGSFKKANMQEAFLFFFNLLF